MLSGYLNDPNHGWGVIVTSAVKITTVWFPKLLESKKYYTSAITDQVIAKCPEAIRGLNDSYRASLPTSKAMRHWSTSGSPARSAHCYVCKKQIDSSDDLTCEFCKWIICPREGACGCGFGM